MAFGPGSEVAANLSAVGLAHEVTFNTPVVPSQFAPFTQLALMPDPGLFYPATMMAIRETDVFPLYGQEKLAGALDSPLFPLNGILSWVAAVGTDSYQSGSTTTAASGVLATATVGATTLTSSAWTGANPIANQYLQVSGSAAGTFGSAVVTAATAAAPSFVTKITAVSGSAPTFTFTVPAIPYAVTASNTKAQVVVAPFFHSVQPANRPISLTVEKNVGGVQSEQYAGSMVNSFGLKLPATNTEASFSADFMSASVAILGTPTVVTGFDSAVPFVFAEGALSLFGQSLTTVTNVSINLANTVKDTYTVGNSHLPTFLTPTTRSISGQLTVVFYSLNDATYGYFQQAFPSTATGGAPTQGALALTLTHPTTGGSFFINLPLVNLKKIGDEIRIGDVVMQTLDFTAAYSLTNSYMLQTYFSDSQNTAF